MTSQKFNTAQSLPRLRTYAFTWRHSSDRFSKCQARIGRKKAEEVKKSVLCFFKCLKVVAFPCPVPALLFVLKCVKNSDRPNYVNLPANYVKQHLLHSRLPVVTVPSSKSGLSHFVNFISLELMTVSSRLWFDKGQSLKNIGPKLEFVALKKSSILSVRT